MVFLSYRWMGHDYWGIGVTIVHFITTKEFILLSTMKYVKLNTLPLITFVIIFGTLIAFYLYLRQHTILNPERNDIIRLYRTTRSYYFFCTYITCTISIFSVIRGPLCHCNGAYLKPKTG